MSEINLEELSKPKTTRPELEKVAVDLGLVNASKYANKPAVLEAITKVHDGADAATVDTEYTPVENENGDDDGQNSPETTPAQPTVTENDEDDEQDDDDAENASDAPKKRERLVRNRNQGHPTAFDENGRPLYRM